MINDDKIQKYCQIIANESESNEVHKSTIRERIKNSNFKDKDTCIVVFGDVFNFEKCCGGL